MIHLYVTLRDRAVGHFEIPGDKVRIGRHPDNEVQIDSMAVSRHHCVLDRTPAGGWVSERRDVWADFKRLFGDESEAVPPLVGVAIGTIVERYLPVEWTSRLFGRRDPLNILWIALGSVPVFLHQISASSIVHHIKSSLPGTLDNGAALAFMIGGPVTAVPTMVLFWTIFRKRVFFCS